MYIHSDVDISMYFSVKNRSLGILVEVSRVFLALIIRVVVSTQKTILGCINLGQYNNRLVRALIAITFLFIPLAVTRRQTSIKKLYLECAFSLMLTGRILLCT